MNSLEGPTSCGRLHFPAQGLIAAVADLTAESQGIGAEEAERLRDDVVAG
jgi:hypothetical protein